MNGIAPLPFCIRYESLDKPVTSPPEKLEKAKIAKHLKLLANLWPNKAIAGVNGAEIIFEIIHLRQRKLRLSDGSRKPQYIQGPASDIRAQLG